MNYLSVGSALTRAIDIAIGDACPGIHRKERKKLERRVWRELGALLGDIHHEAVREHDTRDEAPACLETRALVTEWLRLNWSDLSSGPAGAGWRRNVKGGRR